MMSPRFSNYLDLLRVAAALVVLLSHFAYPRFTDGNYLIIRELNLGSDAVILFFVLSGCVIAFAADCKDASLGQFLFQRATRLYSVALPALLLTLTCDRLGATLAPDAYAGWWYAPAPATLMLLHGLLFSNEWGAIAFRLGTNGPYWSLSYEAAYYVLFGIAFYLSGARRLVLLAGFALLFGIKVLALMPAWLLGTAVYQALKSGSGLPRNVLRAMALMPPLVYGLLLAVDTPGYLLASTTALLGSSAVEALRFSSEFLWNALIGLLIALHIYGMGSLLEGRSPHPRLAAAIHWFAGASFSLYVVHYPVMQFLSAVLPQSADLVTRHLLLLGGTLASCLVFAQIFERNLHLLRRGLKRLCERKPAGAQAPQIE